MGDDLKSELVARGDGVWPTVERHACGDCGNGEWYDKGTAGWVCTKCLKTHAKSGSEHAADAIKYTITAINDRGEPVKPVFYQDSAEEIRCKIEQVRNSASDYEKKLIKRAQKIGDEPDAHQWVKTKQMNREAQIRTLEKELAKAEAREKAEAVKRKLTPAALISRL